VHEPVVSRGGSSGDRLTFTELQAAIRKRTVVVLSRDIVGGADAATCANTGHADRPEPRFDRRVDILPARHRIQSGESDCFGASLRQPG
jgi:hypothetical protein